MPPRGSPDPLVVAHRGASRAWPEHTRAAVAAALAAGADAVECDVRLSADGVPVCLHDGRVDRTSDGRGRVGALTLAQLRRLDFGSWHPAVADGAPAPADAHRLLTLAELVEQLLGADRPVGLLVETKHPVRRGTRAEAAVVDVLAPHAARLSPLVGMSFWPTAVMRLRSASAAAGVPMARASLRSFRWWLPLGRPDVEAIDIGLVRRRPGVVAAARRSGRGVFVWTVDAAADVELCRDLGVDAIITDRPAEVRGMLSR